VLISTMAMRMTIVLATLYEALDTEMGGGTI